MLGDICICILTYINWIIWCCIIIFWKSHLLVIILQLQNLLCSLRFFIAHHLLYIYIINLLIIDMTHRETEAESINEIVMCLERKSLEGRLHKMHHRMCRTCRVMNRLINTLKWDTSEVLFNLIYIGTHTKHVGVWRNFYPMSRRRCSIIIKNHCYKCADK